MTKLRQKISHTRWEKKLRLNLKQSASAPPVLEKLLRRKWRQHVAKVELRRDWRPRPHTTSFLLKSKTILKPTTITTGNSAFYYAFILLQYVPCSFSVCFLYDFQYFPDRSASSVTWKPSVQPSGHNRFFSLFMTKPYTVLRAFES